MPRNYIVTLPTPEFRDDWRFAAGIATGFWQVVADDIRISSGFRQIAAGATAALGHAIARMT